MLMEILKGLGFGVATIGGLWVMALAMGNGRCWNCGRFTVPWSVYCHRHNPYRGH